MFVTSALTVGQLTFILRAVIQVLSYGGIFIIGFIVLASAPRVASLQTHDTLNRVVGRETAARTTRKWIFNAIRGKNGDPVSSPRLILALTLLSVYSLLVALSDLGFLGLYACNASYTFEDRPASVNSTERAQSVLNTALVNGTNPSTVKSFRCDSTEPFQLGDVSLGTNDTIYVCTSWHNSTLADFSAFTGINTTDSDILLPRFLRSVNHSRADIFDLNSYRTSFGTRLTRNTTVANGIVVEPNDTGMRTLFGVPSLQPRRSVDVQKTMALEVEVGCMNVGIFSSHDPDAVGRGLDYFSETDTWRVYTGPENLRDVLSKTVDDVRSYYSPFFNTSSQDGYRIINSTGVRFTDYPQIDNFFLPDTSTTMDGVDVTGWIKGNCTERLRTQLSLDPSMASDYDKRAGDTCELVVVTGMVMEDGDLNQVASKMVCATTTQVNMVSGTVSASETGQVTVNMTRLPSDLNQLRADYFDIVPGQNATQYNTFDPIIRYTLSDNPNGATSHFIFNINGHVGKQSGAGSGGFILAAAGTAIIDLSNVGLGGDTSLQSLDVDESSFTWGPGTATKYFGRLGASYILNSVTYNGWVAESGPTLLVSDTGGPIGTCYKPPYVVSFIPLLAAAVLVIAWILFLIITRGLVGVKTIEDCYGGLKPYWGVVCPTTAAQDAVLLWENAPGPHLQLVTPGQAIVVGGASTAAHHLKSSHYMPGKV
ncbi:hypothetical protein VNI00_005095 [Paramarasmius palmivorus]|uniref:Uncharacterized protein n=1 Tax=Paramarasmius palmivorus TaxID=297713 RepID=A0AAW0DHT0_9AGAR